MNEPLPFSLCPKCLETFQRLRYSWFAQYQYCIVPHTCILWDDEHPGPLNLPCDGACAGSVSRLIAARKRLWLTGAIPQELKLTWETAQQFIPKWPGFRRLKLNARERQALDGCESELADLFGAIPRNFPNMQFDQQSDGTTRFVATKEPAPDANKATKDDRKPNDGEPMNSRKA